MSRAVMSSVAAPNPDVKKVRLYRNGDVNFTGKDLVFNRRQVKTIDRFLQTATEHVDLGRAARSIHTPRHGTVIKSLDEITDKESYVVVGQGSKFRPLNYGMLDGRYGSRTLDRKRRPAELEPIKIVEHSPIRVPGRMHQSIVDVIPIYVYCNGEDYEPPKRILLTDNMFRQQNARRSWEMILAEISRHVQPQFSATTQLYTLDGTPVRHRSELTPGKEFVAVGYKAPFRHMNYVLAGTKPAFNVSPRIVRRNLTNGTGPYYRQNRHARANYSSDEESSFYMDSSNLPPLSTQSDPVQRNRPPYSYDYKVVYTDGRTVFPTKSTARPIKYQEPLPAIADDNDDVGVFKARTARVETNSAKEVDDVNGPKSERRYYADNKKPKTLRTEAETARDVNENVQPAHTTRRTNPTVRNSRMETEETRQINDEETMSDVENNHRDEDYHDVIKRKLSDPNGRAIRRRTTSHDVQRRQPQDPYQPQQRQQSKRSMVSNGVVTPKRRSDAGRQVVKCGATVEVQCSHDNDRHRMDYGSEADDDEEGRRRHQLPVPVSTDTDDHHRQNSTQHFIFINDDDEEGNYNRRESSKAFLDGDQDSSIRNKTPDQESGQGASGDQSVPDTEVPDNERQETPKVDGDKDTAADDSSTRNKTPDHESDQGASGDQSVQDTEVLDNERQETSNVNGEKDPAADDSSTRNKTPGQESDQGSSGQVPDFERRESSKAGESYRENEEQNAVEESEDNVNQQDADNGDQPETREQEEEDRSEVKDDHHSDVHDDNDQQDDKAEQEAAAKIQAAFKGYKARKHLRQEQLQKDPGPVADTAADKTAEEETAAEAVANN